MIVKLDENPGFDDYSTQGQAIKAIRMNEDFMVETAIGFVQGRRGDFIVEIAPRVRFPCSAEAFLKSHLPVAPEGCDRRCGLKDRRDGDAQK